MAAEVIRQEVLALLLRDTPSRLWEAVSSRMRWAYSEGFAGVSNDPRILAGQKPAKLLDDRFYLAERALHEAAGDSGITSSGQKIEINGWVYTLVRSGGVCVVQAYVKTPQDFARPAKFREQHAALNKFLQRPQFAFGDVPPDLFDVAAVAGIMIHGPAGKKFEEEGQRIGFLNFAVPSIDYERWEINMPVSEIVSVFKTVEEEKKTAQRDIAKPDPKKQNKKEGGDTP